MRKWIAFRPLRSRRKISAPTFGAKPSEWRGTRKAHTRLRRLREQFRLVLISLCLSLISLPALAAFEGELNFQIASTGTGKGKVDGTVKALVSKNGWRSEMNMAARGQRIRLLMIGKSSEKKIVYLVNESLKKYARMDINKMQQWTGKQDHREYAVKKKGKARVAGFACDEVEITEKNGDAKIDACIAKNLFRSEMTQLFQQDQHAQGWMRDLKKVGIEGAPIRMVVRSKKQPTIVTTTKLVKARKYQVPPSMFEVPAGYQQASALEVFAQTGPQAAQMKAASEQMQRAMKNMSPEQRKMIEEMMKRTRSK